MTISTTASSQTFIGNGTTTMFAFSFVPDSASDLEIRYTDISGNITLLNPSVYSVSITATPVGGLWGIGGIITYPLSGSPIAASTSLTVTRAVPFTQDISISNQGAFYPAAVEQGLDILELQIQQLSTDVEYSIKAPLSDLTPPTDLPSATLRANKYMAFDSQGNPVAAATPQVITNSALLTVTNVVALKALAISINLVGSALYLKGYYTDQDGGEGLFTLTNVNPGSDNGGTIIWSNTAGYYFVRDTQDNPLSVRWFGAKGDGSTNDSTSIQNCINQAQPVYFPSGTYKFNVSAPYRVEFSGAGTQNTSVKANNSALAILTLTYQVASWSPGYVFRGIKFQGVNVNTDIGITMAQTDPANYAANNEFAALFTTFYNCHFDLLNKGVQRPFGNIGIWFFQCQWSSCYYGTYNLDAKFGGTDHAGCFFVIGGHTQSVTCGHYFNNATDGFGQVNFRDHIFETNPCNLYVFNSDSSMISPVITDGCWNEANGNLSGHSTITIDTWTGTTKGTETIASHAFIYDGASVSARMSGFISDIWLRATNGYVRVLAGSRVEQNSGFGGNPCIVDNPSTAKIIFEDYVSGGGGILNSGSLLIGTPEQGDPSMGSTHGPDVMNLVDPRWKVQGGLNYTKTTVDFTGTPGSGTGEHFSGHSSFDADVVSDGQVFNTCNDFTITLTSAQFEKCDSTITVMSAGYWVHHISLKAVSGNGIKALIWDETGANELASFNVINDNQWHTYAGITKVTGTPTVYLDFTDTLLDACHLRLSAFNLIKFSTYTEAQEFLRSGIYAS